MTSAESARTPRRRGRDARSVERGDAPAIEEGVHDVRKRCKEVRALARLVRGPLGNEFERFNVTVRDAADVLAPIRDAQAVLATLDDLRAAGSGVEPDSSGCAASKPPPPSRRRAPSTAATPGSNRPVSCSSTPAARQALADFDGFEAIGPGLERSYRRGRRSLREAIERPTDECVHEWRKSVKNLWYQTRCSRRRRRARWAPVIATLDKLGEALGDDHDLAVLVERLAADPHRYWGRCTRSTRSRSPAPSRPCCGSRRSGSARRSTPRSRTPSWRGSRRTGRHLREGPELTTGGITELAAGEEAGEGATQGGGTRRRACAAGDHTTTATAMATATRSPPTRPAPSSCLRSSRRPLDAVGRARPRPRIGAVLILAIIVFGLVVGIVAQMILGSSWSNADKGMAIVAGLVGSFVGGLLFSLVTGDGIDLAPSGLIGSVVGAVVVTAIWQWFRAGAPQPRLGVATPPRPTRTRARTRSRPRCRRADPPASGLRGRASSSAR